MICVYLTDCEERRVKIIVEKVYNLYYIELSALIQTIVQIVIVIYLNCRSR